MLSLDKEVSKQSNLDSFLNCATPVVPSQFLSKSETKKLNKPWHAWEREKVGFFTLGDLWDSFDEWSACGLGVPIISDGGHNLTQYFVPYLSAIQIFTSSSPSIYSRDREDVETISTETRNYSSSDSFSDVSESEKLSRWDDCSSEEGLFDRDSFWNSDERLGNLYFQQFETSSPYGRVPLVDKVNSFSRRYPGIKTYRSVDLSPASWMAVAWYPIYHIPMGRTIKDFQTCFLTYHTLSSSFQDTESKDNIENFEGRRKLGGGSISLRPFGLATYKMQVDVWISDKNGGDGERLASLSSVADSWLKQLRVQHHDFNYFMGFRQG